MESADTMPKHNSFGVETDGLNTKPLEKIEVGVIGVIPKSTVKTKSVVLMVNAKYRITGKYSGQAYFFDGAGSRQEVDETDVDWLVSLSRGNVCCGGGTRGTIFALAEV